MLNLPRGQKAQDGLCAASALQILLKANEIDTNLSQLADRTLIPQKAGSLQSEVMAAARQHALLASELPPSIEYMLLELQADNPVVMLIDTGRWYKPNWHYTVLLGYDLNKSSALLSDLGEVPLKELENMSAKSGFWAFTATRPPRLPVTVKGEKLISAVERLRSAGFIMEAKRAYMSALAKTPNDTKLIFALSNVYMQEELYDQAKALYMQLLRIDADHVPTLNNLAFCYMKLGDTQRARRTINKAQKIGGFEELVKKTAQEIQSASKQEPR